MEQHPRSFKPRGDFGKPITMSCEGRGWKLENADHHRHVERTLGGEKNLHTDTDPWSGLNLETWKCDNTTQVLPCFFWAEGFNGIEMSRIAKMIPQGFVGWIIILAFEILPERVQIGNFKVSP